MARRRPRIPLRPGWDLLTWLPYVDRSTGTLAPDVDVAGLLGGGLVQPFLDGRLVPLPLLLDGLVLVHVVSAAETAGEYLEVHPDLSPLLDAVRDGIRLGDGGIVACAGAEELADRGLPAQRLVLTGPPGWLEQAGAGDPLAVLLAEGRLHLGTPSHVPDVTPGEAAAARRILDGLLRQAHRHAGQAAVTVREFVWAYVADDVERCLAEGPPLGALVAAGGGVTRAGWIAATAELAAAAAVGPELDTAAGRALGARRGARGRRGPVRPGRDRRGRGAGRGAGRPGR